GYIFKGIETRAEGIEIESKIECNNHPFLKDFERLMQIAKGLNLLNSGTGIIFLDEIDANLSGKEAMSIANVLNELSAFYQIFAIS
ncbi:hypothetical protein VWM68_10080, partial [Campylobacter coli]